jgi:hypothetical protein
MELTPDDRALLEVTRRHTRAAAKQMRTTGQLLAQMADRLDEVAADYDAQPKEAQRDEQDSGT